MKTSPSRAAKRDTPSVTSKLSLSFDPFAILEATGAAAPARNAALFTWPQERVRLSDDWAEDRAVLAALDGFAGVVLRGFSLFGLESVFRLRALQILGGQACLKAPSAVFVDDAETHCGLIPGLGRRVKSSWPFESVIFVADGAAAASLSGEDLPVVSRAKAAPRGIHELLRAPGAIRSQATEDQGVGVQVQPPWGRCGSSTAFANEIETLNERGLFTIRTYLDHQLRWGSTAMRHLAETIPENAFDAAPHLEVFASADGRFARSFENEFEAFEDAIRIRTRSDICDPVARALALRAEVVIVNRAVSVGFAARACPAARIVLDTHDYLTRNAVEVARLEQRPSAFPDCVTMRRHLALERRLRRAADICTTPSLDEERRLRRGGTDALFVLPEPRPKRWTDPGEGAEWDALVVADDHAFNVRSVAWLLEDVVSPDPRLRRLRIAVVGRVQRTLEPLWA